MSVEPRSGCGLTFGAADGRLVEFTIAARDDDELVMLNVERLPAGATMFPQLPLSGDGTAESSFSWIPSMDQTGLHQILFFAIDESGLRTDCEVPINVRIATTLVAKPIVAEILPGGTVMFGRFEARLTASTTGAPIAGRYIDFRIGGPVGCGASTDGDGVASCGNVILSAQAATTLGYFAFFSFDLVYFSSSAHGSVVRVAGTDVPDSLLAQT